MAYFTRKKKSGPDTFYLAPGNVDWDTDSVTATPWTLTPDPSITQP